jgi:hypothetical protein
MKAAMTRLLLVLALVAAPAAALAQSCAQTAGRARAADYVRQCREVSPATRPPCDAGNPCDLIISEIRRGCAMLTGADRPRCCAAYR